MTEVVHLPMVCIHEAKDGSTDHIEAAKALREEVKGLLSWENNPCTDADLISRIVLNMHWDWNADFDIGVDMWFGVYAKVEELIPKEERTEDTPKWRTTLRVTCECDQIEDGFCAIYKWFHENRKSDDG